MIYWILMGALAGWISGKLIKGRGFGAIGNIVVGIVGAMVGGLLQDFLGLSLGGGMIGGLISAVLGAVVLLFIVGLIKKD